jgi:hypothetical protein
MIIIYIIFKAFGILGVVIPILKPTFPVTEADSKAAEESGYPKNTPARVPIAKVKI